MKRHSRLVLPLLFAAAMAVLHWAVEGNPGVLKRADLDHQFLEKFTRLLIYVSLAFFVVRALDYVFFDLFSRRRKVRAPVLLREIVTILLFAILIGWAVSTVFETNVTAFLATGTVLAAVLGLALQETLGNLFAGIALHLEDSFEIGDVIRSGEHFGVVEAVRWRATWLRTFSNNIVIVPNSLLARERLEVFPRNNLNARVLTIGIDVNVPPATALAVLSQAASHVDGVSGQIPAFARIGAFAESSVVYEIKYHMYDYSQRDRIDSEIRKAVWYALRRNSIPIPLPMRTHVQYTPPASASEPARADIVGRLERIDILSPLPPAARESIAAAAHVHTFAKGETILSRGAEGNSMFVLHEGNVSVRVDEVEVARLGEGDFFGEMALLTGEKRAADIVALTDVIAVEITKDALQQVLHDNVELAHAISTKVMERRDAIESLKTHSLEEAHRTVLSRIRAYFGL